LGVPLLLRRADAEVTPELVSLGELDPLVELLEKTPREKCPELVAGRMRHGTSYRQWMAALFLAAVRNVNPRPPGFALHSVFVIHSAHVLAQEAPADARLLPLFYSLDNFKAAQERDARASGGDWSMAPLKGSVPAGGRAASELRAAMEAWDMERAERAAAGMARHGSAADAFAMLYEYGARDYRNIGHKAIFVANAARTLDAIGWQHAEPVLRSLALGLLDFGTERSVNGYAFEDQCYLTNRKLVRERLAKLPAAWARTDLDESVTRSVVEAIRTSSPEEASEHAMQALEKGHSAGAIWDAVHLAAAELRMRCGPGAAIVGLHAVTSANALHYGWLAARDSAARLLHLLQAAGWMTQFRHWSQTRQENLGGARILDLKPSEESATPSAILAAIGENLETAGALAMAVGRDSAGRRALSSALIRETAAKADEVHYYKYQAAIVEDTELVNQRWRPHMSAASVWYAKSSSAKPPVWLDRSKEALGVSG